MPESGLAGRAQFSDHGTMPSEMSAAAPRLSQSAPTEETIRLPAHVPPAGPAWFGAVMGTAILSTLTQTMHASIPFGHELSLLMLVLSWVFLLSLTVLFIARIIKSPAVLADSISNSASAAMWGMVSMGILSVGAATATVIPATWPALSHIVWTMDAAMWSLGTLIGIITALGFGAHLIGRNIGSPTTVWGLAVVGPMVSATTGASLVPHIPSTEGRLWMLVALAACFFLSLFLGAMIFAVAYNHHWRISAVPLAATASVWIPLGVVGQSTAAAQAMGRQAMQLATPEVGLAVQHLANFYGYCMLTLGVPLIAWAAKMTVRGFANRMPFAPGWWALTFPIGTLSLGAHLLGELSGVGFLTIAGTLTCGVLLCTWLTCAIASARAIASKLIPAIG